MSIISFSIRRRKLVIAIWVFALIALTPSLLHYSSYLNYSLSNALPKNSESQRAQALISSVLPQNSTLIALIKQDAYSVQTANKTLSFEKALSQVPYFSSSQSVYTSYASFLDKFLGNKTLYIRDLYYNVSELARKVFAFPSAFYSNWSVINFSNSKILEAYQKASGFGEYDSLFLNYLISTNTTLSALQRVNLATLEAARSYYGEKYYIVSTLNITNYKDAESLSLLVSKALGGFVSPQLVQAISRKGDPGYNYVKMFSLLGAPSFVLQRYLSSDNTTQIVFVYFNVSEEYRGKNNFYPAQAATPLIRSLLQKYFGSDAYLTGEGALAYDTQQQTKKAGIVFAFTFVLLAFAVSLTLVSLVAPILDLVFVSIATALGYFSIFVTGVLFMRVDFVVNYTLSAVILGVTTDYLVFMLARYREELRLGRDKHTALHVAMEKAGSASLISGITVAASLGALSFVAELRSWGPVLFMSVILSVLLVTTLLPALTSYIGPRIFLKSSLNTLSIEKTRSSRFYKAASFSSKHKYFVLGFVLLVSAPAIYAWFTLPTTTNLNQGLPSSLPSVQANALLTQKFGAGYSAPMVVIVNSSKPFAFQNGTLTPFGDVTLKEYAKQLFSVKGVTKVLGATANGSAVADTRFAQSFLFDNYHYAYFLVYTNFDPSSSEAIQVVKQIRSNPSFLVGGLTSSLLDEISYSRVAYEQLELIIVLVIALVLALSLRSLSYPVISLSGVFVSITWTTALLYVISVKLLHEELIFLIPIILYVILMSLGNDFSVFILSRIKEETKQGEFVDSLSRAMASSALVVTSLGLILAASLGSLAFSPISFLRQLGLAFAISLILDTFVIRVFYFPALVSIFKNHK